MGRQVGEVQWISVSLSLTSGFQEIAGIEASYISYMAKLQLCCFHALVTM